MPTEILQLTLYFTFLLHFKSETGRYKVSWLVVGKGEDRLLPDGPFKYRMNEGVTVKKIRYSKRKHLLFIEDVHNQKSYIEGCVWWSIDDGFGSADLDEKVEFFVIMNQHLKRVKENGLDLASFRYLAHLPKRREEQFPDAIKYLVEQKKKQDRQKGEAGESDKR